ncbi:Dihydrofolate reductase type 3 [compost metagenome]
MFTHRRTSRLGPGRTVGVVVGRREHENVRRNCLNTIFVTHNSTGVPEIFEEKNKSYLTGDQDLMVVSIIAAVSINRVIGMDEVIPWNIRGEQKRFKDITLGNSIIMERRTYESKVNHYLTDRL